MHKYTILQLVVHTNRDYIYTTGSTHYLVELCILSTEYKYNQVLISDNA